VHLTALTNLSRRHDTVITKIKNRLASEQGFTLIELLVVIVILGILVAIAVPAYLSFVGSAKTAAAESNVRSAIPAAESYYQSNNDVYTGLTGITLRTQAPGVSPNVMAISAAADNYCIQDTESSAGGVTYSYIGGIDPTPPVGKAATIQAGTCATNYGTAATT
jgi:prepilin-type N-terminal cleavage/methylation domain-containing protein